MEKRNLIGVTEIGTAMLLYGITSLVLYRETLGTVFAYLHPLTLLIMFATGNHLWDSVIFTIISFFILKRKNWARKFTFVASITLLLCHLPNAILVLINPTRIPTDVSVLKDWYGLPSAAAVLSITFIPLVVYIFFIYYFSRPTVKEQFK